MFLLYPNILKVQLINTYLNKYRVRKKYLFWRHTVCVAKSFNFILMFITLPLDLKVPNLRETLSFPHCRVTPRTRKLRRNYHLGSMTKILTNDR